MNLDEFQVKFAALRQKGYVRSARRGPTGVGHTLEQEVGLIENNLAVPDLGNVELKSRRDRVSSLVTLFTFNRKAWVMKALDAIRKHGTLDIKGRRGLYFTMSVRPNSSGLFMRISNDQVWIQHVSGEVIVRWELEALAAQFSKKLPALVLVTAHSEDRDGVEYFHFYRAQLLTGTAKTVLADQLRYGSVVIDLRLHDQGTRARNHGTGFRAPESRLDKLFTKVEEL